MTHTRSCNATALLLCCAAATQLSNVEARAPRLRPIGGWRQAEVAAGRPSTVNCTWANFSQKIDHFGDAPGTFPQRYCIYDKWWRPAARSGFKAAAEAPGPILFYTGNESPVEEYINNTGLMWELGEQMGALLVFAEHRYEPLSHPALRGKGSQKCFAYCTTAQANADWAALITELRTKHSVRAPAVAFGGSYGGMLAGWFRMKYPDVIDGAIAASAPIWQLAETVERETLDMQAVAITRGVSSAGGATDQCADNLRAAWPLLTEVGQTARGLFMLSESVNSCAALQSPEDLPDWAQGVFFYMAEGNYPFPSTYITYSLLPGHPTPLPAWPMRVACEGLSKDFGIRTTGSVRDVNYTVTLGDIKVAVDWANTTGNGETLTSAQIRASGVLQLAAAVAQAAGVWHNLTKDKECFDIYGAQDSAASDSVGTAVSARQHRSHMLADARVAEAEQRAELAERRAEKAEAELAAAQASAYPSPAAAAATAVATDTAGETDGDGAADRRQLLGPTDVSAAAGTGAADRRQLLGPTDVSAAAGTGSHNTAGAVGSCPACPPCDDCPPCPVSWLLR
jgi:pimeloyl-ACP methyl ester carboxylesterase